jgi:hypothetical protein
MRFLVFIFMFALNKNKKSLKIQVFLILFFINMFVQLLHCMAFQARRLICMEYPFF